MTSLFRILSIAALSYGLACESSPAALLAYYSFDSDFSDGSGNGNNLTTANGTPNITTTSGEHQFGGGALNLVNTDNEYLSLSSTISFAANETWSVSFWAQRNADSNSGMIMGNSTARNSFIWWTDNFNGMRFRPEASASASNDFNAPKVYSEFHHFVMVADGTGALRLYVDNGAAQLINPASSGTSFTINAIGQAYDNAAYTFGGQIDEVYVFDEAVNTSTVSQLFNDTYVIPEPGSLSLIGLSALVLLRRRRA